MEFSPNADELIVNNVQFAATFTDAELQVQPKRHLAIVACMDSRMDIFEMLGLGHGDAHIIRNAGGVVTDDVIRSLSFSQRKLGSREIILIHHTDCGLQNVTSDEFAAELVAEAGAHPSWTLEAFRDPYADVARSIDLLRQSPFIAHTDYLRGFVYEVTTGRMNEVLP